MNEMVPIGETLAMLFNFLFAYTLLFILLPMAVLRFDKEHGLLDKVFISLTHATLFFILATHLLAGIRLLETLSLYSLMVVAVLLYVWRRGWNKEEKLTTNWLRRMFDLTESKAAWRVEMLRLWRKWKEWLLSQVLTLKQSLRKHPILYLFYVTVFTVAIAERLGFSLTHLIFASSDPYVHLGWAKNMIEMNMYSDGVYPYGFESILVALFEVFRVDIYPAIRFMGPLTALLVALSIIFTLRKMTGQGGWLSLLAVVLFFFSSTVMMNDSVTIWRHMSALSMEFALIFLMPGMAFLFLYFKQDKRRYLLLAAECLAISILVHPFVAVVMGLGYVSIGLVYLGKMIASRSIWSILGYMTAAGLVGVIPPAIGLLAGIPFHGSSVEYFREGLEHVEEVEPSLIGLLVDFADDYAVLMLFIVLATLFVILFRLAGLFRPVRHSLFFRERNDAFHAATATLLFSLLMIVMYIGPELGLPAVVALDRQPVFMTLSNTLLFSMTFYMLTSVISRVKWRQFVQFILCAAILVALFQIPGQKQAMPPGDRHQYDEAVRAFLDIRDAYPIKRWDIISTVNELSIIRGYGYHTEIWEFAQKLDDESVHELLFQTPHVFLFVEKIPLDVMGNDERPITIEDARAPFPVATDSNLAEFYYVYNVQNRRILMAKSYYWAEAYRKQREDMSVYLETDRFIIYEIYQGRDEVILDKRGVTGW